MKKTAKTRGERFYNFTKELEKLSKKYKIAIRSVGGVYIDDENEDYSGLEYSHDETSGDLLFEFYEPERK